MIAHEMTPANADSASIGMNTNEVSIRGSAIAHRSTKVAIETTPAINRRLLAVLEVFTLMSVPPASWTWDEDVVRLMSCSHRVRARPARPDVSGQRTETGVIAERKIDPAAGWSNGVGIASDELRDYVVPRSKCF